MPSKYGFLPFDEIKAAKDVMIEKGKKEAVRIDPIIRDVLEDYKKAKGLEYPITCKVGYTGEGKADRYEPKNYYYFGTWELGNYASYSARESGIRVTLIQDSCSPDYQIVSLYVDGSGSLGKPSLAVELIKEVLKKALGYSSLSAIFNADWKKL